MAWTVELRIKTIKNYSNYGGMEITAKEIEDAVMVVITYYRIHGQKAYENVEFWIVPNANLEDSSYLTKDAYQLFVHTSRNITKVFSVFRRRWHRGWL